MHTRFTLGYAAVHKVQHTTDSNKVFFAHWLLTVPLHLIVHVLFTLRNSSQQQQ
jgi:hypothetical protein